MKIANNALDVYNKAMEISENNLASTPVRLGLALNFSVFYYDIMKLQKKHASWQNQHLIRRYPTLKVRS